MITAAGPARGAPRAGRAGAFALAAVSLALAAHTVAGGHLPDPLALLTAAVGTGCLAVALTGREVRPVTAVAGLAGLQALLHVWFSLTAGHGCDVGGIVLSGHHHAVATCAQGTAAAAAPGTGLTAAVVMPAAHVLAVLLTGALLARGERALWQLAALARTCLAVAVPTPVPVTVPATARPRLAAFVAAPPADPARTTRGLRGPPVHPRG